MENKLYTQSLFEDRIIVFLDILGFKDIVNKNQLPEEDILNLLYSIRNNNRESKFDIKEIGSLGSGHPPLDKSLINSNSTILLQSQGGSSTTTVVNISGYPQYI